MTALSRSLNRTTALLAFILAAIVLLCIMTPQANTQVGEDVTALSYRVFNQVAQVYRSGGSAPDLVAKLNVALGQIQESRIKMSEGDNVSAARLEDQARSAIADVMKNVPVAQSRAERDSVTRTLVTAVLVPVVVVLSTFTFYEGLIMWRWYEKTRLFRMRIIEKEKIED